MKRILLAIALSLLFTIPAQSIVPLYSIVPLLMFGQGYICTTWSVNEKEGYWVTAAHCAQPGGIYFIQGKAATIVDTYESDDILIMRSPFHAPALKLRATRPNQGEHVYSIGFPGGLGISVMSEGMLAAYKFEFLVEERTKTERAYRSFFLLAMRSGHSGSPIMDKKDRVISMHQLGSKDGGMFSGGIEWDRLVKDLRQYVE